MRRLFLASVLLAVPVLGCAEMYGTTTTVSYASGAPAYVLLEADGSCWADRVWYPPPCPWTFDGPAGYYYYWHAQRRYIWRDYRWANPHQPPPNRWIAPPVPQGPHRHWRYTPPPRRIQTAPPVGPHWRGRRHR